MLIRWVLIVSLFLVGITGSANATSVGSTQTAKPTPKIGQYVQFGSYLSKPVVWRVINLDANGNPLLFSESILALKAFDAAGPLHNDAVRKKFGSNLYEHSTLRRWLNSNDVAVTWKKNLPAPQNFMDKKGDYTKEPGFLSATNFTTWEQSLMVPTTNRVILHHSDQVIKTGGNSSLLFDAKISSALQNYDKNAFYQLLSDKVFLLSVQQLHAFVYNRGYDIRSKPTLQAVNSSPDRYPGLSANDYWHYWLNTPNGQHAGSTRFVFFDGMVNKHFSYSEVIGVRPATVLDIRKAAISSGSGSLNSPFVVGRSAPSAPVVSPKNELTISGNQMFVNQKRVSLSANVKPIRIKGQMMVPARATLQAMGLNVSWNANSKSVVATRKGVSMQFTNGRIAAVVNGTPKTMSVAATDIGGTLMVPAQFMTRELKYSLIIR